jgi:hypothetical protein
MLLLYRYCEVIRLCYEGNVWRTIGSLQLGEYSSTCASDDFAIFMTNDSIAITKWDEETKAFGMVQYFCNVCPSIGPTN